MMFARRKSERESGCPTPESKCPGAQFCAMMRRYKESSELAIQGFEKTIEKYGNEGIGVEPIGDDRLDVIEQIWAQPNTADDEGIADFLDETSGVFSADRPSLGDHLESMDKVYEDLLMVGVTEDEMAAYMMQRFIPTLRAGIVQSEVDIRGAQEIIDGYDMPNVRKACISGAVVSTGAEGMPQLVCGSPSLPEVLRQYSAMPYVAE